MKVKLSALLTLCCLLEYSQAVFCQQQPEEGTTVDKALHFPDKVFSRLNDKASFLNKQLDKQTERYLARMAKQEMRLRKKIAAKDSSLAKRLFDGVDAKYNQLQTTPANVSKYASVYSGTLDSLNTSLSFLKNNNIGNLASNPELQKTLGSYAALQSKLNATEQVRQYLAQRRQVLQQELEQLGMMKELNKYKQQVALYQSQVQEYKNILNEPSRLESTILSIAQKIPSFKSFFASSSLLGSMFALPGGASSAAAANGAIPAGLQTRAMVNQALVNQFGSMDAVTQALQQAVPSAQGQLQQLKDKLGQYTSGSTGSGGGSSSDMPDYSINPQRTKSFWRRLVLGTTVQSQKAYGVLPVTSDLGLSLGFKLSDKQTIGIGVTEKIGWGSGWNHIRISEQGMGIRSFLDVKLKGSIWITGGYEMNYTPGLSSLDSAANAHALRVHNWTKSGLVGLSKQVQMKSRKAKVQVLWDFLSYYQQVKTPAIIWRVDYSLK